MAKDSILDINDILNDYSVDIQEAITEEAQRIAKKGASDLRKTSPKRTGDYKKGWRVKTTKGKGFVNCVIHNTSGTMVVPSGCLAAAISMAVIKFSFPSVRSLPIGNWLPVRMTGLLKSSNMKLSAEAVKAMVSVPCRITKPSYLL